METWMVLLGAVVLLGTLADVFLTALNYDEAGFLAAPLQRLVWRGVRTVTRRLPRRRRPVVLRQVIGLQVVSTVALWVVGTIVGYGLVYYGLMTPQAFSVSGDGADLDLFSALYFSAAQLATVGGSSLTAETDVLRFLSIVETLTGVVLISLVLTFLLGVYSVISDLNALCTQFLTGERGAGAARASLAPYFRGGEPVALDGHVDAVLSSFSSYVSGVRLHRSAYYFQSGRDRFALPYALRMTSGTVQVLRYGLPTGHPASQMPGVDALAFELLEFGAYLQERLGWTSRDVPGTVDAETFRRAVRDRATPGEHDGWVGRFLGLERDVAALAGVDPLDDVDDAYRRYTAWLPFAYRAEQITLGVGHDLDYQPIIVTDRPVSLLEPADALAARSLEEYLIGPQDDDEGGGISRWRTFVREHVSQVDPGFGRLRGAARALVAALLAGLVTYALLTSSGLLAAGPRGDGLGRLVPPAIFSAFVAMLSTNVVVGATSRARRRTSALLVVPVTLVVVAGALSARSPVASGVTLVLVGAASAWVGRFGPRWGAVGGVTFMAYYFAVIMRLQEAEVVPFLLAAVLGVVVGYLLNYVVWPERPGPVLRAAVEGFGRDVVAALDALVDAVAWGRWDPDVRRRVEVDVQRLHRGAQYLGVRLLPPGDGPQDALRAQEVRLRLFDTTLAVVHLTEASREVTGTTLPLELRGRLAGRLVELRAHISDLVALPVAPGAPGGEETTWRSVRPPASWPPEARALARSLDSTYEAVAALVRLERSTLDPSVPPPEVDVALAHEQELALTARAAEREAPHGRRPSPSTRRAVQSAVAVGAAFVVGDVVSTGGRHEYWATLAAYQVLGGTDGETFVKGAQRVLGTVGGVVLGFGVALGSGGEPAVLVPLLLLAVFANSYFRQVSPVAQTFWTTTLFAVVYEFLGRLSTLTLEVRVLETVVGAAVALLAAWLVLPTRTRSVVTADMRSLVADLRLVLDAALARLDATDSVATAAIERHLAVLGQDLRTLATASAPLRRSVGASGTGGIEGQLTALGSLTFDTRTLVRSLDDLRGSGAQVPTALWARAHEAIGRNLGALVAVLSGHRDVVVDEDLDLLGSDDVPSTGPEARAARHLDRINDTLVWLVGDLAPAAVVRTREAPTP